MNENTREILWAYQVGILKCQGKVPATHGEGLGEALADLVLEVKGSTLPKRIHKMPNREEAVA